ncbi:hypothetical protein CHS0354_003130 [Potamilus streckersoni]|uniref:Uncharacterized protein n=1 Tax=Potamilus streckersoni TaxID=2493646 RepID=A0AAE0VGG9_9BIVA|nr:hypothetical protein CHS0354_003130 [Potamilus streckersoni]
MKQNIHQNLEARDQYIKEDIKELMDPDPWRRSGAALQESRLVPSVKTEENERESDWQKLEQSPFETIWIAHSLGGKRSIQRSLKQNKAGCLSYSSLSVGHGYVEVWGTETLFSYPLYTIACATD